MKKIDQLDSVPDNLSTIELSPDDSAANLKDLGSNTTATEDNNPKFVSMVARSNKRKIDDEVGSDYSIFNSRNKRSNTESFLASVSSSIQSKISSSSRTGAEPTFTQLLSSFINSSPAVPFFNSSSCSQHEAQSTEIFSGTVTTNADVHSSFDSLIQPSNSDFHLTALLAPIPPPSNSTPMLIEKSGHSDTMNDLNVSSDGYTLLDLTNSGNIMHTPIVQVTLPSDSNAPIDNGQAKKTSVETATPKPCNNQDQFRVHEEAGSSSSSDEGIDENPGFANELIANMPHGKSRLKICGLI